MLVNRTMKRCARGKVCFTRDNPVRNKKKKKDLPFANTTVIFLT